ncbi:hypothetical protein B0H13DRAFT_1909298 [Mycena leptocephala]|nr:hypothetical protein B0H13DRAFT_1909298 [Mycena leptocephala]
MTQPISVHNILGIPIAEDAGKQILQLLPTLAVEMGLSLCEDLRFIDGEGRAQESDAIRGFTNIEGLEQRRRRRETEPTHEGALQLVRFKPEESRSGGCNQLRIIPRVDAIRGFANIEGLEHEGCFRFKMQESRSSGDVERPEPTHEGGLQLIQFKAQNPDPAEVGSSDPSDHLRRSYHFSCTCRRTEATHEGGLQLIRFKPQNPDMADATGSEKSPVFMSFAVLQTSRTQSQKMRKLFRWLCSSHRGPNSPVLCKCGSVLQSTGLAVGVLLLALGRELQKAEMEAYYDGNCDLTVIMDGHFITYYIRLVRGSLGS